MKKLSIYISTLLLICQFGVDAMDVGPNGGRKRGGDDFFEDQFSHGRLSPVPMELHGNNKPWEPPMIQAEWGANTQTNDNSFEGETKKRKQTVLIALKDLMGEARMNPTLLGPLAI